MATAMEHSLPRLKIPVTVVIPLYDEEDAIPNLASKLEALEDCLSSDYDFGFVLIDDGSKDSTWQLLNRYFAEHSNYTLIHQENAGVAAAILTGIRASQTEIVCSMDCDCTYDPRQTYDLIPMLTPGVDLVTGSPYHPLGAVLNVPAWRLLLSKGSSFLYRCVLRQKLFTYTSCFRVYRRSAVEGLSLTEGGYLGIAEMLATLDLRGSTIREVPATLSVRVFGQSKMRIGRTILGHLRLLFTSPADSRRPRFRSVTFHRFSNIYFARTRARSSEEIMNTSAVKREVVTLPSDQDATGRRLGAEEISMLSEAIASGTLTSTKGEFVRTLETRFAEKLGVKHAFACASGTAAVHTAIAALNPDPGDEIVQPVQ